MELLELGTFGTVAAVAVGMIVQGTVQLFVRKMSDHKRIRRLEKQVKSLQSKVTLLESAHQSAPIPMWLKDSFGIMLALNESYEQLFLKPRNYTRDDYLYKGDEAVWPEDLVTEFRRNDLMVARTGEVWKGFETIVDHQGKLTQWQIIKYPRKVDNITIGIAGIAIPPP